MMFLLSPASPVESLYQQLALGSKDLDASVIHDASLHLGDG